MSMVPIFQKILQGLLTVTLKRSDRWPARTVTVRCNHRGTARRKTAWGTICRRGEDFRPSHRRRWCPGKLEEVERMWGVWRGRGGSSRTSGKVSGEQGNSISSVAKDATVFRNAEYTPAFLRSMCCILLLLILLLILLFIIFNALFNRYAVTEFLIYPPVCEECRRKNPALVSAALPSSGTVADSSRELQSPNSSIRSFLFQTPGTIRTPRKCTIQI